MRHAIHVVRQLLAVEMDARALVHVVREDRPDAVSLDDRQTRAWPRAVEAERLHWLLLGVDGVIHLFDGQLEDLDAVLEAGLEGRLPGRAMDSPSPPRNRSTAALAFASLSIVGPADGATDGAADPWAIDGAADAGAAAGLAAAPGARLGPWLQVEVEPLGAQAARPRRPGRCR